MVTVQLEELQQDTGKYLDLARTGELLVIVEGNQPVLQIVPVPQAQKGLRPIGLYNGKISIADDFDDPLPDDILADFEGRD